MESQALALATMVLFPPDFGVAARCRCRAGCAQKPAVAPEGWFQISSHLGIFARKTSGTPDPRA